MSETPSRIRLAELKAALQTTVEALRWAVDDAAMDTAIAAYNAAWTAYDVYQQETAEELIWAPMRARIEAACVGQPPIVQEAMRSGVSVLRVALTDKERGQLQRARRKGLLVWDPNWHFNRPTTLICSPSIVFGGTHES